MSTYTAKVNEVTRNWYVIDLAGKVLGREATRIADTLRDIFENTTRRI